MFKLKYHIRHATPITIFEKLHPVKSKHIRTSHTHAYTHMHKNILENMFIC